MTPALTYIQQGIAFARVYAIYAVVVGIFALAGLVLAILQINSSANAPAQADIWALPKVAPTAPFQMLDSDVYNQFWSEEPRAAKTKAKTETVKQKPIIPWRFLGTVDRGKLISAVIEIEGKRIQQMKNGETLPDGTAIVGIEEGALTIQRQGSAQTLRLFAEKKPE